MDRVLLGRWGKLLGRRPLAYLVLSGVLLWYSLPRMVSSVRFAGRVHEPEAIEDIEQFLGALPPEGVEITASHAGTHHYSAGMEFLLHLWFTPTTTVAGYPVEWSTWDLEAQRSEAFLRWLRNSGSFEPYTGPKLCNGFHPDLAVSMKLGNDRWEVLVCKGCAEALVFRNGKAMIADLSAEGERIFWALLDEDGSSDGPH